MCGMFSKTVKAGMMTLAFQWVTADKQPPVRSEEEV